MPDAIAATPDVPSGTERTLDTAPARWPMWTALAAGALLTLLAGFGGALAAIAATLAQPAFALGIAQWRGRRIAPRKLPREGGWLASLWGGAFLVALAVVLWPLSALREGGSLVAALGLSLVAGVLLLGVWRLWPLWHGQETEGGRLARHWGELGELDAGAWRGLGVAAIVVAMLGAILLLAW